MSTPGTLIEQFSSGSTVLVLAPHTDDGEFGCGATISKLIRTGSRVIYVAFSAAEQSVPKGMPLDTLRKEVRAATAALGIADKDCVVLHFEVRQFPNARQEILDSMIKLGQEYQPDLVFHPSAHDTHQDHKTVADEAFRAYKRTTMLGYEVPWNNLVFQTSCFIEVDEQDVDRKIAAMQEYKSQQGRSYSSAEYLRSLAIVRGMQIHKRFAETFEVTRLVIS